MNFPILSSLILLPSIGALFILISRSTDKTNLVIKILLGVYMSVATFIWFVCVSLFLTHKVAINLFHSAVPWIERITGILLLGISIQIILQQL